MKKPGGESLLRKASAVNFDGKYVRAIAEWGDDITGIKVGDVFQVVMSLPTARGFDELCYRIRFRGILSTFPTRFFTNPMGREELDNPVYGMF